MRAGVDYDGGVRRFGGKAQLYEKYLLKFFDGDPFANLQSKLAAGDAAALSAGMNGHIAKPIDTESLYETLAKYLRHD